MVFTGKLLKRQPKICRFFFENRYKFGANCPRMDLKDVIDQALNNFFHIVKHFLPE